MQERYIDKEFNESIAKELHRNFLFHADDETHICKSEKDYLELVEDVAYLWNLNSEEPLSWFYKELLKKSELEKKIEKMVYEKEYVSGIVVSFGTSIHSETIISGNQQEKVYDSVEVEKIEKDSIFDLASLTKFFTCLCVLKIVEQKLLRLDSRLGDVDERFTMLSDFTIESILSFSVALKTKERLDLAKSKEEAMHILFEAYPDYEDARVYSDIGAMILKIIVEKVTGKSMWDNINDIIINPCDMHDTYMNIPDECLQRVVSNNYERRIVNGEYIVINDIYKGIVSDGKSRKLNMYSKEIYGHAGIFTTAGDMGKLISCFLEGKIISKDYMEQIGINRTGKKMKNGKYTQFHGWLCYSKNPIEKNSEVNHWLSGNAFALGGYTGNHMMIDVGNGLYSVLLSNRCHNRVTNIVPASDEVIYLADNGQDQSHILWNDGNKYVYSKNYAFDRDEYIVKPMTKLLMEYAIIEKFFKERNK